MKNYIPHILGALFVLVTIGAWMLIAHMVKKPADQVQPEQTTIKLQGSWVVRTFDDIVLTEDSVAFPTVSFLESGVVTASAGCNGMGGNYEYADGRLVIKDGMCQTEMWCENEQMMRNERLLAQTLHDTLSVVACGRDTVLISGTHSMKIVR